MKRAFAFVLLTACSSSKPVEAPKPPPAEPSARIFYELPSIAEKKFPVPLVRGSVAGKKTIFILDTGAQIAVVASWLAHDAGLPTGRTISSHDPAGNDVAMRKIDDAAMGVDGLGPLPAFPAGIVELPPIFEKLGIGGLIPPQALARADRAVKIDFAKHRLSYAPIAELNASSSVRNPHICTYDKDGFSPHILVAEADVDGVGTTLEIDTGADEVTVIAESEAGRKLALREDGAKVEATSAAGTLPEKRFPNVPVGRGIAPFVSVTGGTKHSVCGYEGRVGAQQLRTCVLVVGLEALRIDCTANDAK